MMDHDALLSRRFALPQFDHAFHYHIEIDITFIERSSGTRIVGDHAGVFREGELYVLGTNLPHWFHNKPTSIGVSAPRKSRARYDVLYALGVDGW